MTKKKKEEWITAAELMAQLEADPEYIARSKKHDEEHQARVQAHRIAMIPLTEELRACGCSLSSSGHLTNQPNIPTAIPILLAHLQRTTYPPDVRTHIAYALAVPEIKAHWDILLQLYRAEREEGAKDGLANAIISVTDNKVLGDVIALVRDKSQGTSRIILLHVLKKTKDPRGRAVMEELANDPDLAEQIAASLKHLDRLKIRQAQRQARKNPTRH